MTAPHTHKYTIYRWPPNFVSYVQQMWSPATVRLYVHLSSSLAPLFAYRRVSIKKYLYETPEERQTETVCGPQAKATFTSDVTTTTSSSAAAQPGLVFRLKTIREETSNAIRSTFYKLGQQPTWCANRFFIRSHCHSLYHRLSRTNIVEASGRAFF